MGMVDELATKVHPVFREIVKPPCIDEAGKFGACVYVEECERRLRGQDLLPPCPLHLYQQELEVTPIDFDAAIDVANQAQVPMRLEMMARALEYEKFWGRNPFTGEKK